VPAILDDHPTWGVTCHQLDADFDTGPILASRHFPLSYQECHESLDFKVQMAAKALATDVAEHFVEYWDHAQPQGAGSYFKHWSAADRTLDWNQSVHDILRRVRAFGPIECMARINDVDIFVRRAVGWEEAHGYVAGAVIHVSALKLLVAVKDGFVGIVEWHLNPPGVPDCAGER
jgi:methionyl-tRNA formyltransferase